MSKPTPPHWKTVRVHFSEVADGYGHRREIHEAGPGLWEIIGATTIGKLAPHPNPSGMIAIIVAPARVAP